MNKLLSNRTAFGKTIEQILVFELEFGNYRTKLELSDKLIERTDHEKFINKTNFPKKEGDFNLI